MNTASSLTPNAASFDAEVLNAGEPVLVEFWAPWCGPCRAFQPIVEHVATERGLRVAYVNVDDEPGLAQRHGVRSIPALKLFSKGELVAELTGSKPRSVLSAWLESHDA